VRVLGRLRFLQVGMRLGGRGAFFRPQTARSGLTFMQQGLNPEAFFAIAFGKPDDFAKGR
jgi:hypothetical protein